MSKTLIMARKEGEKNNSVFAFSCQLSNETLIQHVVAVVVVADVVGCGGGDQLHVRKRRRRQAARVLARQVQQGRREFQ